MKQDRLDRLMQLQEQIAAELSAEKVGKIFRIIIDRVEEDYYIGRTEFDSPEVDCEVLVSTSDNQLEVGQFYEARVTAAEEFDLCAEIV